VVVVAAAGAVAEAEAGELLVRRERPERELRRLVDKVAADLAAGVAERLVRRRAS
jgi:hypothetical protein